MDFIPAREAVIGIPVEDYDSAIDWYVKVLGCELVFKMGIAQVKLPSGQKLLLYEPDPEESSIWYAGDYKAHPHFCIQFVTSDIRRLREELIANGARVGDLARGGGGGWDMMFYDPSGNRLWAIEDPKK
ncbi:VOC family protein [Paenibacillus sp. HJGM_3]|uniref:VOC family protein n=1 Tax=Paenibacillus sp. HJGM_3 TaxID=3379816 RepID=UPI00385AFDF5